MLFVDGVAARGKKGGGGGGGGFIFNKFDHTVSLKWSMRKYRDLNC